MANFSPIIVKKLKFLKVCHKTVKKEGFEFGVVKK